MPKEPLETYTVQQKFTIWYQTTVEARNRYEAIENAEGSGDWECLYETADELDTYWVMNEDTTAQYDLIDGEWFTDGKKDE